MSHSDAAALGLGGASFMLGTMSKLGKHFNLKRVRSMMENRFAVKDSILNLLDKEN